MHKITELADKKLIDVDTARDLGHIKGVAWSKAEGNCAIVTDEGNFKAESIFAVKDAASVIKAEQAIGYTDLCIGKTAYDTTGKYLGKLAEVELGNTLKIGAIRLDDGSVFSRGKLYALGDVLLIRARTPTNSVAKSKTKRKANRVAVAPWRQNRRYGDFNFLIGKTVDKTITNFQGELMIKQGERVTGTILHQAKLSGKLIELCLHTK